MKKQELFRKCQLLLIIAFGSYPLVMAVLDRLGTGMLPWGWAFPAVYVAASMVGIRIRGKWRLSAGIAMAIGMAAAAFVLAPDGGKLAAVAAAALCGVLMIWSLKMGGWSSKKEIPVIWIAYGVASHFLGQVLLHTDRVAGGTGLAVYSGAFLLTLFGFALLTMISMNRGGLTAASGKRQSVPDSMRQKNGLMIVVFFVLAVLASLLPSAFAGLTDVLRQAVVWIVAFLTRLIPKAETGTPGAIPEDTSGAPVGVGGGGNQMMLDPAVEQFMAVCGAIITFLFLGFLLYHIVRSLARSIRKLVGSMGKFASSVSEDYIDEVTDTRQDFDREKVSKERRASRIPFLEPRNLPPAERIRFRYQRILYRHPEWDAGSTARETLPGEMAALYERARYSPHPVTEADAERFADGSKHI